MKSIIGLLLLVFFCVAAHATHIINSNIQYNFKGLTAQGNEMYEVTLIVFRDCDASGAGFDDSALIAVYYNDASKNLYDTLKLKLTKEETITPFIYPSGNLASVGCYKKGSYTFSFTAPKLHNGFYVLWQRCCRRPLNNIINDQGNSALAFIPKEGTRNNSPVITDFKESMIMGANVLTELDFSNQDVDGDSLVYELTSPLGGLDRNNPIAFDYPATLPKFSNIAYAVNFSFKFPVTVQVPFLLNANSGKATIISNRTGIYLVGITVSEYRKGQLIAKYNREHILLFLERVKPNGIDLEVLPNGTNAIECKWSNTTVFPVQYYQLLKRKAGEKNWDTIAVTGRSYIDTAIDIDTLYEYAVKGVKHDICLYSFIKQGKNSFGVFTGRVKTSMIIVYPNPAANTLFIETNEPLIEIAITDLAGKQVFSILNPTQQSIDVSGLPAGIYYLLATCSRGTTVAKFSKN